MIKVRKIEISFPETVEVPEWIMYELSMMADRICKVYEGQNPTRKMWPASEGSKPQWSKADAAFLGVSAGLDAPNSGEPKFDDSIYQIGCYEREDLHGENPLNPDGAKLREERAKERRQRREDAIKENSAKTL